jgi:hypothetical protein
MVLSLVFGPWAIVIALLVAIGGPAAVLGTDLYAGRRTAD